MQSINPTPTQTNALPANPLALNDIHVPEQITSYPIAYGWWLLALLLLLIIIIVVIKINKTAKRNQVKKQALIQLKNNSAMDNNELISLLKWAAMHYFSRVELAKLYGDSLQQFLLKKLPEKHQANFSQLSEQAFNNQYQAHFHNEVDTSFQQAALLWLNQALPPKKVIKTKQKNTGSNQNQQSQGIST
ncbi:MAG: hypothetical protein COA59_00790 [Colwellia sp.]|nr:MAG: hypothetical protein COA59_00790 [Colwellia sp.]